MSLDVSIVIVTYKCREAARDCLASIYETTSGVDFEVIVLDNASEDGTVEMVRSDFPEVRLIASLREPRLRGRVQRGGCRGRRRLRVPPQPRHRSARRDGRAPRRVRAQPPGERRLRRADPAARRRARPGVVLGGAVALEPRLLRHAPDDGVPGLARSSIPRRWAAGSATASAKSTSSPAASSSSRARAGRSSAASTCASSCTGRTPTSRSGPGAWGSGRSSRRTPW